MKKIVALLMASAMAASLAACGGSAQSSEATSAAPAESTAAESTSTDGKKYATTILALISVAEGAGVFLCGCLVPPLGNLLGGGAGANLTAASVVMILLGVACFFVMKPAHKAVYEQAE